MLNHEVVTRYRYLTVECILSVVSKKSSRSSFACFALKRCSSCKSQNINPHVVRYHTMQINSLWLTTTTTLSFCFTGQRFWRYARLGQASKQVTHQRETFGDCHRKTFYMLDAFPTRQPTQSKQCTQHTRLTTAIIRDTVQY